MKKNSLFLVIAACFVLLGLVMVSCEDSISAGDGSTDNGGGVGTFRINLIGIPSSVITEIQNGRIIIGMGPPNALLPNASNVIAGRNTSIRDSEDRLGSNYYEFYMYPLTIQQPYPYVGSAGRYDIGILNTSNGSFQGFRNVWLNVNTITVINYGLIQSY